MRKGRIKFDTALSGVVHRLLGPSPARARVTFIPPATGNVTISNEPNIPSGLGFVLQQPMNPLVFDDMLDGDVVHQEWWVVYSGTFAPVGFLEVQH